MKRKLVCENLTYRSVLGLLRGVVYVRLDTMCVQYMCTLDPSPPRGFDVDVLL